MARVPVEDGSDTGDAAQPAASGDRRAVVHLVPHTHWDREWYLPFERFRLRLVDLVDGLLDEMERDPRVRFTLDGQTATVDDYLAFRPLAEARLSALVAGGRLAVGPWAILMDEFLVSGETIVRNLEAGVRRAAELGQVMRVGYLPDMFGHVAQMPQILSRAGIADAVVWRGVPHAVDRHAFTWRAPDGSAVRTEYLYRGYGQARDVFALPERIEAKLDAYASEMRPLFGDDDLLAMYGEDHSIPLPGYAAVVDAFNAASDRYEVRIETLGAYIEHARSASPATIAWDGELRSSARANVLMGVASHRIEVRRAAGRAERWLERVAEPLLALHADRWPALELATAWRCVIENSAHDSICACSAEETIQQVLARFATAEQIARGLVGRTLDALAADVPRDAWVVWNPSPVARRDLVEIVVPQERIGSDVLGAGSRGRLQDLGVEAPVLDDRPVPAAEVIRYLRTRMHARELYTYLVNGYDLVGRGGQPGHDTLTVRVSRVADPPELDVDALLDGIRALADAAATRDPDAMWQVRVAADPQRRLLVRAEAPPLGLATAALEDLMAPRDATEEPPVTATGQALSNGLLRVEIAPDGTLRLEGGGVRLAGVGRIVDGGDVGDSYNYAPPATDTIADVPLSVRSRVLEAGPLRGRLEVARRYAWPLGLADGLSARSADSAETRLVTLVELRAGEPFARIEIAFENPARDHRVRFHIPLPARTDRSFAEGQFAVVERGLTMEGGHGEYPLPTFPAHGLVAADGVTVLLDHLTEYELVDGSELAITLLRATGLISRDVHPWRAEPAGPVIAAPSGQGLGERRVGFAVLPSAGPPGPEALRALESYRNPFHALPGTGGSGLPAGRPGLTVDGDGIVLTSLRRRDDALEVRIVNETPQPRRALVSGPFGIAWASDLLGGRRNALDCRDGTLALDLGPWEIATVQLSPASALGSSGGAGGRGG